MRKHKLSRSYNQKVAEKSQKKDEDGYEADVRQDRFDEPVETKSLAEDARKASLYAIMHKEAERMFPDQPGATPMHDRFSDIWTRANRERLLDEARPVLTNEFADFKNPYMMIRSTTERLLRERCMRNQLDE